ncbi:MAG: ABC transporter substrate-binding protein [Deltaproteobacteria bacterium]|nr:ABC transporter substrate-binding protein [Deltaproteobacteria bacterium]
MKVSCRAGLLKPLSLLALVLLFTGLSAMPQVSAAEPVKVGFLSSLSGVLAVIGEDMRDGFLLYMDQIGNKAAGREIKVIVEDIGSNEPGRATQKGVSLIQKDKIDVLAGVVDSGSAQALARLAEKSEIPFVITNAGTDELTQHRATDWIVRCSFSNSQANHLLGEWAYEKGYRRAVVTGSDFIAGYQHVGGFCRTFTKAGGKIIQEIWAPLGTQDFSPFLTNINPEADVVMAFYPGADALRFVTQYAESGLKEKIPLIGPSMLVDDSILPKQGKAAEGIVNVMHWCLLLDTPENREFKEAYAKKYGRKPSLYSEQGYIGAKMIAEALTKTKGEAKGKDFVKAMRGLEIKAPRGDIKFDESGQTIQTYHLQKVEIKDGVPQNVVFQSVPAVSQFWKWTRDEFLKMPPYSDLKGEWAK